MNHFIEIIWPRGANVRFFPSVKLAAIKGSPVRIEFGITNIFTSSCDDIEVFGLAVINVDFIFGGEMFFVSDKPFYKDAGRDGAIVALHGFLAVVRR